MRKGHPQHHSDTRQIVDAPEGRRLIGVLTFAAKLNCHPASIPRFIRTKESFPKPGSVCGKNVWYEDVADAYIQQEMSRGAEIDR
jgi:hypothetical protein